MINYTIIIPHKNIPKLLQRCLDSIPERDDIQIVIVDDNSSPDIVDFSNFPGENRKNVDCLFPKKGKGAGYARNLGLKIALGKWYIFADADDFFNTNFLPSIDKYVNSNYDVIYFQSNSVNSETLKPCETRYEMPDNIKEKRLYSTYRNHVVWGKMFNSDLIINHNIKFDETVTANDVMFSVRTGTFAKEICFSDEKIYCATVREKSLVTTKRFAYTFSRLKVSCKLNKFICKHNGPQEFREYTYKYVKESSSFGFFCHLKAILYYITHEHLKFIKKDITPILKEKFK